MTTPKKEIDKWNSLQGKRNIIQAWNEIDEVIEDFACNDDEIVEMQASIRKRLFKAREHLDKLFTGVEYDEAKRRGWIDE